MKKLKLNNQTYDFMKWLLLIFEPALITLIEGLGIIYKWDTSITIATIGLVSTFLGSILGISSINYHKGGK